MKTKVIAFLICFIVITIGCSKDDNTEKPTPKYYYEVVEIDAPSLSNSIVDNDVTQKAKVFLPPNYMNYPDMNYPVVYFIHGYSSDYQNDYGIFRAAYNEMLEEKINEFFIVTVNSNCDLGGTFCVNSPVTGNWEDHISDEVISYIDANYRTIQQKESRGIAGFSMGGFGALYLGLRHADVYNLAYAISPGVLNETDFMGAYNLWQSDGGSFINAYGAAFSPNTDLRYPHAEKPTFSGTEEDNQIIENWKDGFENFDLKISEYLGGEHRLKSLGIDYGSADYYWWIPRGCSYLAEILEENNIPHEEYAGSGVHEVNINNVKANMLPFFSENLSFE